MNLSDPETYMLFRQLPPEEQAKLLQLEKERQEKMLESGRWEKYKMGTGQSVVVHARTPDCDEHGCCIHNPSDHVMRDFKTHWRGDRSLMERICPHGVGHPDPDDLAFHERTNPKGAKYRSVHGCDGCCEQATPTPVSEEENP